MKVVSIRHDPYDVYIGRAGHGQDGYYGNPFVRGQICSLCDVFHAEPGDTLRCYARYFLDRVERDPEFRERVSALRGKVLGCFCAPPGGLVASDPLRCHGQVILRWLRNHPA